VVAWLSQTDGIARCFCTFSPARIHLWCFTSPSRLFNFGGNATVSGQVTAGENAEGDAKIKILVADDHQSFGRLTILPRAPDRLKIVGEASGGNEAEENSTCRRMSC
jgi:hypothetical protein